MDINPVKLQYILKRIEQALLRIDHGRIEIKINSTLDRVEMDVSDVERLENLLEEEQKGLTEL